MALLLKFIAMPLYPLGMAVVFGVLGITFYFFKKKLSMIMMIVSFCIFTFFSFPVVAQLLVRSLEKKFSCITTYPDNCSAIVVLGGGGTPVRPQFPLPEVNDAGDRIIHGSRLIKAGVAKFIITTGNVPVGDAYTTTTEGVHNAWLLKEFGVDSNAIVVDPHSRNTAEHPRYIGAILDSLKLPRHILLVTSASHMFRSVAVFKKHGFSVVPVPVDFHSNKRLFTNVHDFFPNAHALSLSTIAMHEIYGIIGYKILRWM